MGNQILDAALEYLQENIAVIPTLKSKGPDLPKKSKFFWQRATEEEAKQLFKNAYGVGIKCGSLSEGIECMDFDDHDQKHNLNDIIRKIGRNEYVEHLIQEGKLFIERSQSGGWHFVYRYEAQEFEKGSTWARWHDGEEMIETRGEGQYFVAYPTPGYEHRRGSIVELVTMDKEERDILIEIAKSFNQYEKKQEAGKVEDLATEDTDPVSVFNLNKVAYAKKLLEDKGWEKVDEREGIEKWKRPGKKDGISATWGWRMNALYVFSSNAEPFEQHCYYTPFQILVKLRFKGKYQEALKWLIQNDNNEKEKDDEGNIPYIRVGTTYFKKIKKKDRYGILRQELKPWEKKEIIQDHGKDYLNYIPRYDDFTIEPNNFNYQPVINNCYNLFREFKFEPKEGSWYWTDVLLQHIFKEQYELGLKYLQALYLYPKRILPILALVSKIRGTGKTTFINWLSMIFGDNMIVIGSEDIKSQFNASYAGKNIVCVEETTIDRKAMTEKLKALSTGKQINVNQKFVNNYKIPLYSKIIITSNDESRFAQIEDEEIRYFVRKLDTPKIANANIEDDLIKEIPAFLHYLTTLDDLNFTKSRMLFTPEELDNEFLRRVKKESKPSLYKDIREYLTERFHENGKKEFYATPKNIKEEWFYNNSRIEIHYIRKVLKEDFKLRPCEKMRYDPFGDKTSTTGTPFKFERQWFIEDEEETQEQWEEDNVPF
ncbi:MAG: DUF5906 domain-containing protein [Petrotogales bacterium]